MPIADEFAEIARRMKPDTPVPQTESHPGLKIYDADGNVVLSANWADGDVDCSMILRAFLADLQ